MEVPSVVIVSLLGGTLVPITLFIINQVWQSHKGLNDKLAQVLTVEETRALVMDLIKPMDVKQELVSENIDRIEKKLDAVLEMLLKLKAEREVEKADPI